MDYSQITECLADLEIFGQLDDAQIVHSQSNPDCGDIIKYSINFSAQRISKIKIQAFGCPISVAAAAISARMSLGQSRDEIANFNDQEIFFRLGEVSEEHRSCVIFALQTLKRAISLRS